MAEMVKKGINSFKFFMAYKGALMVGDELLLDGMQRCKQLGALAMVDTLHAACCHTSWWMLHVFCMMPSTTASSLPYYIMHFASSY